MKLNKSTNYKENTVNFFNKMANRSHGDSFKHYKNTLNWLDVTITNNNCILLDLGTGKGDLLLKIVKKFKKNKFYKLIGLDISPEMIKVALNKKLPVDFKVGDSEDLPFENCSIDIITCINSFHHYPNPEKVVSEITRVLKPNGTLILGEIWILPIFRNIINAFLPYMKTGDYKIYSSKEIKTLFAEKNIVLLEKKYIFPSNYTYLLKKTK